MRHCAVFLVIALAAALPSTDRSSMDSAPPLHPEGEPSRVPEVSAATLNLHPLSDVPVVREGNRLRANLAGCGLEFDAADAQVSVARAGGGPVARMRAVGHWQAAEIGRGAVSYASEDGRSRMVYRPMPDGAKEDLILLDESAYSDGRFGWTMELGPGLDARPEADGSISIREGARRVARLPAPVVVDATGARVTASFVLSLPLLAVQVARPAAYPVAIDPTVVLTLDADFRFAGSDEGLVRFSGDQVHRDAVTGWKLASWSSTLTFTTPRRFHGTAVHNKRLYVFGGVTGASTDLGDVQFAPINDDGPSAPTDAVYFAAINSDGSVGTWTSGTSLPAPRAAPRLAANNGWLYVLGGIVGGVPTSSVMRAQISSNGSIGAWTSDTSMSLARRSFAAAVVNGRLYAIGGETSTGTTNTTEMASINADGSLGAWSSQSTFATARAHHDAVAWGMKLFLVCGGAPGPVFFSDVQSADVDPATGSLGPWSTISSVPTARATPFAFAHGGWLYVGGGNQGPGAYFSDFRAAPILSSGALGSWQSTTPVPASIAAPGKAVVNGRAYLFGGGNASGPTSQVIHAAVEGSGALGAWSTTQSMPEPRGTHISFARNGLLYVMLGHTGSTNLDTIKYAATGADGSLGAWQTNPTTFPAFRHLARGAIWGDRLYVGGGEIGGASQTDVWHAPFNADGTLGAFQATSSLPAGRQHHGWQAWNGRLYAFGGDNGQGTAFADSWVATINPDGSLGAWTATTPMPAPDSVFASVVYDGHLFVIGGGYGLSTQLRTRVMSAPINPDGTVGAWTLVSSTPGPHSYCDAVAEGGFIYLVPGTDGPDYSIVSSAALLPGGRIGSWSECTRTVPPWTYRRAIAIHKGVLYVSGGDSGQVPGWTNMVQYARLRTPAPRATYSKLVDLGGDQAVTSISTTFGGSNGTVTISVRSATSAAPTFGAATTAAITSGAPLPYVTTARYLHLRYVLDDSNNVSVSPDATAHLAIDDITVSTTSPPLAPAGLEQRQDDDFVLIPLGGGANTTTMFVHADISDPDPLDTIRLHVELKPVGVAFTNSPTASTSFATNPNSLSLQVTGLTPGTQYHWQAWVEDDGGSSGPKVGFGGNPDPAGVDFFVDPAPTAPASMGQFESDGATPIPDGGSTLSSTVILKGSRADPDALSQVTIELELQPDGTPFSDSATSTSAPGAPGAEATFTLSGLTAGGYHWQMRCMDDNGKASAWTPFSGSATHFSVVTNQPPDAPATLLQFENDGTTPIIFGGAAPAAAVKFQADLSDPNVADTLKLQVELRPTGVAFMSPGTPVIDGTVFFETALLAQGTQQIDITIPADGTWHWQARVVDNAGAASVWTPAGGNPDPGGVDVSLDLADDPPTIAPATVNQLQSDGTTVIAVGGNATTAGVVFEATVVDPEGSTVTLEIELQDVATALTGVATQTAGPFPSGTAIQVPALPAIGAYHWAYRATDGTNFSAWTSFGGNTENPPTSPAAVDFNVTANAGPSTSALAQFLADGVTPLPIGDSVAGTDVVLQAVVSDPEGQNVRLRVEVKPVGVAFDGATNLTDSTLLPSGSTIQVLVSGLADGAYHWQAVGLDVQGTSGTGTTFGGNPEADPDFRIDATNTGPSAPAGLGQYSPPGSVGLALGGVPFGRTVILKAAASDEELGQIAFEVELQPVGTAFTGTRTHPEQLEFGPAGVFHTITLDDLPADAYHWQIRAVDAQLQTSPWVSYGGNAESAADFRITATTAVPPNEPLGLKQRLVNDLVDIVIGDTIAQAAVRLKALVVHPRTEIVKLQVEMRPLGAAFSGQVTRESGFVESGTVAELVVYGMPNDGYHWQARTVDSKGTASPWIPYGANLEIDADFVVGVPANNPPDDPPFVLQHQANGATALAAGDTTTQSVVTFDALAADTDGDPVRLEVELKPTGVAFDGTVSGATGFYPSGTYLYLLIGSLSDGRYHWRARLTDANGASSAWVAFGGNPESDADFIVNATLNSAPSLAAVLDQLRDSGTVTVAVGAVSGSDDLTFRSDADDADATDLVRLEIEVRAAGELLTSVARHSGEFVPQGYVADAIVGRFAFDVGCQWQARVVDVNGASSGWIEFGGNPTGDVDFIPSFSIAGGGSRRTCGSVGLDLLAPLGLLLLVRRWMRRRRRAVGMAGR